jgi:two-component system, cell cycle response regulator
MRNLAGTADCLPWKLWDRRCRTDVTNVTGAIRARPRRFLWVGGALLAALFVAYVAHVSLAGGGENSFFNDWVYDAVMLGCAASCLLRAALVRQERVAWALLGVALLIWTGGEIYYEAILSTRASVPVPSPADAGYLLFYPIAYAGLIVLARGRIATFSAARCLDGIIVGAAVAALAAALAAQPILDAGTASGGTLAVATNLAYPICDLALLSLVLTAAALDGWRLNARWATLGVGLAVLALSDIAYLLQAADGTYFEGGLLDAAWPLGALLLAASAWIKPPRRRAVTGRRLRQVLVPVIGALVAIGVQAAQRFTEIGATAAILSLATLLAVVARMALSFRESQINLEETTREALTDPLTGLGNRRHLTNRLEEETSRPRVPGELALLVVFDLDGFKAYNDSYGHPAGDALLQRLGNRLASFASLRGEAFRLGGDEFCLLAPCAAAAVDGLVAGATASLGERGDGFVVTASQGSVIIPTEAAQPDEALQLADRRMYANKSRERTSARTQTRDVLLTALRERAPALHAHLVDVAQMAAAVADEMRVTGERRDEIYRAAELHNIGKMAIPDAILAKPGPLDPAEWEFIRTHTLIGERIIAAAPALVPIARLVRSSHERWDGSGYPDGLAGEEIPIGSRIVAACDAYEAMVSDRPYSVAMRPARALEELDRGAGSQFDPEVIAALRRVLAACESGGDGDRRLRAVPPRSGTGDL